MTKRRRKKVSRQPKSKMPPTGLVLAGIGVVIIAVVGLVFLANRAGPQETTPPTISEQGYEIGTTPEGLPYKGSMDAPVTIVAYSDYKCGHCANFALETEPLIDETYVATGKVRFVSHYFNLWPDTQKMALAAMCAAQQGRFWELDQALFANQESLTESTIPAFARQVGLDMGAFDECMQSDANLAKIQTFANQGKAAGVTGTPTFFINGKKVVGGLPFEQFRQEIEQALAGAQ